MALFMFRRFIAIGIIPNEKQSHQIHSHVDPSIIAALTLQSTFITLRGTFHIVDTHQSTFNIVDNVIALLRSRSKADALLSMHV